MARLYHCNANSVTFYGVTPIPTAGSPTRVQIVLSGSDVFGYSDVQQSFNITIAAHNLSLVQPVPTFNLTTGYPLNTTLDVLASFRLDDKPFHADDVRNITLDASDLSWLSYDANNMSLFGIPPTGQESITHPITITDKYGDSVNTTIAFAFFPSHFSTD